MSIVTIRGGSVGMGFSAHNGSTVNLLGGTIGSSFRALAGSNIQVTGRELLLNGSPIAGLNANEPFLFTSRTGTLSGRFADGSAFSFPLGMVGREGPMFAAGAQVTLTLVPEPTGLWLLAGLVAVVSCGAGRRRRHTVRGEAWRGRSGTLCRGSL